MLIKEILQDSKLDRLDAELLLANVLGVDREYLLTHDDEEVEGALHELFEKYSKRVNDGEPVAYILKAKEFYGLDFFVDQRVLVPRPETEMIVDRVFEFLLNDGADSYKLLDVGTGSGNIPIALALKCREEADVLDEIQALDISNNALDVARINLEQHGLEAKIQLFQSDLLENVAEGAEYDVITANLPYIGQVDNRYVEENVEKHEPKGALFGGENGLELYKKMFQQMADKQVKFRYFIGEFGFGQSLDVEELLNKYFAQNWLIEKDLAGIERFFIIK